MDPIAFIINIPIREAELEDIKASFLSKRPYGAKIPVDTVLDIRFMIAYTSLLFS